MAKRRRTKKSKIRAAENRRKTRLKVGVGRGSGELLMGSGGELVGALKKQEVKKSDKVRMGKSGDAMVDSALYDYPVGEVKRDLVKSLVIAGGVLVLEAVLYVLRGELGVG